MEPQFGRLASNRDGLVSGFRHSQQTSSSSPLPPCPFCFLTPLPHRAHTRRREENELRQVDGCTFHPTINPASRRSVESSRVPSDTRSVNERLYDRVAQMKEQKERSIAQAR